VVVAGSTLSYYYFDASGFIWNMDIETGALGPFESLAALYYDGINCSGRAFLQNPTPPRVVFSFTDPVTGINGYRARADSARSQTVIIMSSRSINWACTNIGGSPITGYLAAEMVTVGERPPALDGPLHLEMR
jgi:hypothetical protein